MPKRDAKYMATQRDAIAHAALEVFLANGVSDTSLRDICKAAGISMGALYIHFANKNELLLATCRLWNSMHPDRHNIETWADYRDEIEADFRLVRSDKNLRRMRLSLQFVTDVILDDEAPAGMGAWFEEIKDHIRSILKALHRNGEVTLPLGLEHTTQTHMTLLTGSSYMAVANKDFDIDAIVKSLIDALALTAGLKANTNAVTRKAG